MPDMGRRAWSGAMKTMVTKYNLEGIKGCNDLTFARCRARSANGLFTTNIAFGGADRRDLYITESHTGTILRARVPVPGRLLFSHM